MKGLNIVMKSACEYAILWGVKIPNTELMISNLFYANDALFLGEWNLENVENLARVIHCFHVVSGLKENFNKTWDFGIGVDAQEVINWATLLGCEPSSLRLTYLGILVCINMNLKTNWKPVIKKL